MKRIKKLAILFVLCSFVLSAVSCGEVENSGKASYSQISTENSELVSGETEPDEDVTSETTASESSAAGTEPADTESAESESDESESAESESSSKGINLADIPEYSGSPYVVINGNKPAFSAKEKKNTEAFESYSKLDSLGRCGQAYANVCREIQPTEERGPIGNVKPSGWHTVKYNDIIDGNYLYNRCHLIGYQLSGENANEKNLITGTRYLNVVGMLVFENLVDDYVEATDNHVLYRVTPYFEGDNLVASGVQMEAWSVEDSGKGICFNVYCYNVQPGIAIDYLSGDSYAIDETSEAEEKVESEEKAESAEIDFIINKNTKKFHLPSCYSVRQMKDKNKIYYTGKIEDVIRQGYKPCKNCLAGY